MSDWKDLNTDLIKSDICMQCGRCCKTTWHHTYSASQEAYLEAMFQKSSRSYVVSDSENKKLKVVNWCSNLMPDLSCGIYKTRPEVCVRYNCFEMSNKKKIMPESFNYIFSLLTKKYGEGKVPLYANQGNEDDSDRNRERSMQDSKEQSSQSNDVGSLQADEQTSS